MKTKLTDRAIFGVLLLLLAVSVAVPARADSFTNVGSLVTTARSSHTATLLPNGKVLVAGGVHHEYSINARLESAELYDPASGEWHPTGGMTTARIFHIATPTLGPSPEHQPTGFTRFGKHREKSSVQLMGPSACGSE